MYRKNLLKKLSIFVSSQCQFSRIAYSRVANRHLQYAAPVSFGNNRDATLVQIRCKSTKSHLDHSKVPKIEESDLVEQFVRGSGPGGQATAKTCNAVVLKHLPTGIVVKCHQTRSLWDNKKLAREILVTKLDNMINGKDSLENQERAFLAKKSANRTKKRNKMLALKTAFKEREGIE